jgi:hypothetical protein
VLSWGVVIATAALTALATMLAMIPFDRPVLPRRLVTAAVAAAAGPVAWYLLSDRATPGPLTVEWAQPAFPVSRSHVGVAVCTLAVTAVCLGFGPDRKLAARRMLVVPVGAAIAAFGIAVYLT